MMKTSGKWGIREYIELDADLRAGESTARELAERYEVSTRFIERRKATLRSHGVRLRSQTPEECGARALPWGAR
jgi:predicted DNA-binding transcriptional regulator YafY